jgi:hypothetical protein
MKVPRRKCQTTRITSSKKYTHKKAETWVYLSQVVDRLATYHPMMASERKRGLKMTMFEVLNLATLENPVINNNGKKIEFQDGTTYVMDSFTKLFRKARIFVL